MTSTKVVEPAGDVEQQWSSLAGELRSARRPVLLAHAGPDGDALGSALAVGLALGALGRECVVSFGDDPLVLPRSLHGLPGRHLLVRPADVPAAPELVVAFDCASLDRLGCLAPVVTAAQTSWAVDHHPSYTGFADHAVVDGSAPATAVLAAELVDQLGVPYDQDIATCLYIGLVTDTGSFRTEATTAGAHELAARLLRTGIPHAAIARGIWDSAGFGYLGVLGAALTSASLEAPAAGGCRLVWTAVARDARVAAGVALDELDGVIDLLAGTGTADVAAVFKQDDDGRWRVSLRSRGIVDVGATAVRLGGGGHSRAAGFTSGSNLADAVAALRRALG